MAPIQVRCPRERDVESAAIGVRSLVLHAHDPWPVVAQLRMDLVGEGVARTALATRPGRTRGNEEPRLDAMQRASVVEGAAHPSAGFFVEPRFAPQGQPDEVVHGDGCSRLEEAAADHFVPNVQMREEGSQARHELGRGRGDWPKYAP